MSKMVPNKVGESIEQKKVEPLGPQRVEELGEPFPQVLESTLPSRVPYGEKVLGEVEALEDSRSFRRLQKF